MSSILSADDSSFVFLTALTSTPIDLSAIGMCGTPCSGDCHTCVQSNADLQAFYAPVEPAPALAEHVVVEVTSSTTADEAWEELQREARARDDADEVARTGIWADTGADYDAPDRANPADDDEDDGYRGCQCLDCLNHDEDGWINSYDDRDGYDDGYGLDWNESGYFD